MPPATITQHPPAGGAQHQTFLNKERLHDLLQRIPAFRQSRRQRLNPNRAAIMVFGNARQITPIHGIKAERINFEAPERRISHGAVRDLIFHQREVTHPPQQPPRNTRRAALTAGNLPRAIFR